MRKLPFEETNPASVLALAGIMRITGAQTRCASDGNSGAESDRLIRPEEIYAAARRCAGMLQDWPADADLKWWLEQVKACDFRPPVIDTLSMLGSQTAEGWKHSQWRMIFGQQRWLKMIRDALAEVNETACAAWLAADHWSRTQYMGMTGVDSGAYRPPALSWTSDTNMLSRGNPVSLWLMWEGMHILPSISGRTLGWLNSHRVRWPIWHEFRSIDWLRSIWVSAWLCANNLDTKTIWTGDEEDSQPGAWVSPRDVLRGVGVAAVFESRKSAQPPPYAWRMSAGRPI